jgi:endoglucanase
MSLVLQVAEDAYEGNAQFTVMVDGVQIGGTQTATTPHDSGMWQTVTLADVLPPGIHDVTVNFLNPESGGSTSQDRTLWVNSVSAGGAATTVGTDLTATTTSVTASAVTPNTTPPTTSGVALLGVNLSGAEYGDPVTGKVNYDYTYPTNSEIDYFASLGLNVMRIPILWQRLQPTQDGPLSATQLSYLDGLVAHAASLGVKIIIDAHDYGIAFGNDIGSAGTPNAAFANFWSQMAAHFKNDPNVIFGLMNEPHDQTATAWAASAQAAVTAIRATGAAQEILVSGTEWDGGSSWISSGNAAALVNINDPDNNVVYEVHEYFDGNASGTSTSVVSSMIGPDRLAAITQWAQENGKKLFLGEFGAGSDPASLAALSNTVSYINANSNVWQGGTYWAGGPWNANYMFSADPQNGVEAAQTAILAAGIDIKPTVAPAPAPVVDSIGLNISEDAWEGDAEFTVKINGQQIGGDYSASAAHASGDAGTFLLTGDWGSGVSDVAVTFINDAHGTGSGTDRNLYVNSISENGVTYTGTTANLMSNGSHTFAVGGTTPVAAAPADTLTLTLSEEAWEGDAQFVLSIDGHAITTPQAVTALRTASATESFTFTGSWGAGSHSIGVAFVNDARGTAGGEDRNLYIDGVTVNGANVFKGLKAQDTDGTSYFTVTTSH